MGVEGGASLDSWKEGQCSLAPEEILQDETRQPDEKSAPHLSSQLSWHRLGFFPRASQSALASLREKQAHLWIARKPFAPIGVASCTDSIHN